MRPVIMKKRWPNPTSTHVKQNFPQKPEEKIEVTTIQVLSCTSTENIISSMTSKQLYIFWELSCSMKLKHNLMQCDALFLLSLWKKKKKKIKMWRLVTACLHSHADFKLVTPSISGGNNSRMYKLNYLEDELRWTRYPRRSSKKQKIDTGKIT